MDQKQLITKLIDYFPDILFGTFSYGNISDICFIKFPTNIIHLNLEFNSINILKRFCFILLVYIKSIILDFNMITEIESFAFLNLTNLKLLSLSYNLIKALPVYFVRYSHLKMLSVRNIRFTKIEINAFHGLNSDVVFNSDYHICCTVPSKSKCTARISWHFTCSEMLPNTQLKVMFLSQVLILPLVNIFSIVLHISSSNSSIMVPSLNCSGLLLGLYYCIVLVPDFKFQELLMVKAEEWRSGIICFAAFGIMLG